MNPPELSRRVDPSRPAAGRAWLRLFAIATCTFLLSGLLHAPAQAATTPLSLPPNSSRWAKIGPKRLTSLAQVTVTVPVGALEFGIQFRAAAKSSGYLTKVKVAADGTVTGSFSRVRSNRQSKIGAAGSLGFVVAPGDRIHVESTVVAKKTVVLYLRAWKDGTSKPSRWQVVARDSSGKRVQKPGAVYLWARTPAGSPTMKLSYSVDSVVGYTAAKAASAAPSNVGQPSASSSDDTFSIAVISDTQKEVHSTADTRFADRTAWLAANKTSLDLRYVLHTGDVVDWGWVAPAEYTRAKAAMANLTNAKVPWAITIGNHDSRAVGWNNIAGSTGYGGGPYANNPECSTKLTPAECKSWLLIRKTGEFNTAFPASNLNNLGGTFESGKIDNNWTSFTANNTKWLVLTLEFAPRTTAVDWAKTVVASHPDYNVIIQTHHYLDGGGTISGSNDGYGANSGQYIYDNLVSKYPNIKIVASGHTGGFASRTDAPNGNKVVSYLGNDLGSGTNPVRIITINTKTGEVASKVYSKVNTTGTTAYTTTTNTISITR